MTGKRLLVVGGSGFIGRATKEIFTLDNYLSLQVDSLSKENGFSVLGITPQSLESVMEPLLSNNA